MKAIILSAGQGRRLLPFTEHVPKCMVPINGKPLIAWQIDALRRCGIQKIVAVIGFGADKVEAALAERYGHLGIRTVFNPLFSITDNLISCWVARAEMRDEFLLLNGDTLFEVAVAEALLAAPAHPITLAVSSKDRYDDDDMKVILEGRRLVRVGKQLPLDQVGAESIGMMTFQGEGPRLFVDRIERMVRQPEALKRWYLSVIDELASQGVVWSQPVRSDGWTEVDGPADLQRACAEGAPWLAVEEQQSAGA